MADFLDDELAGPIERGVDVLIADQHERILRGNPPDYAKYREAVGYLEALVRVKTLITELRTPKTKQGDQLDSD